MMRRTTLTITTGLFLAAAVAWWWMPASESVPARGEFADATPAAPVAPRETPEHPSPAVTSASREEAGPAPGDEPAPTDFRAQLRASGDYLEFAQRTLPAARAGDPAAQFYLSSALGYCDSLYEWYFVERSPTGRVRHRTLDEAQQITAARPFFSADEVRDIQARCQRLRSLDDAPFGSSDQWFDAALAQGFPLAQARAAMTMAIQTSHRLDSGKARIARDEARRLAFESLRDGDVEAMLEVSGVGEYLAGEGSAQGRVQRWGWLLAAALRAGQSVELQEWTRTACRLDTQCQPYETPADVIRRQAGNDLDAVERRAREINEKLAAGSLTESDIG